MESSKRIFVNTLAQYTRSLINIGLSLYTVRLILKALGQSDYGIYMLVAGVVSMLGFITNAMVITTQRHLSYHYGLGDSKTVRKMFSNSLLLHLCIAVLLFLIMLFLKGLLFETSLNIPYSRRDVAAQVYIMVAGMLFLTFVSAPFKALYIARENIVFISCVEVIEGFIKLFLVLTLLQLDVDKLFMYSFMMFSIMFFQFIVYIVYAVYKFKECRPTYMFRDADWQYIRSLCGFAGWTTYGMGTIILRNQGLAVVFNLFFSTIVNAAYGIGQQLYAAVSFVSTSVLNAMNPQIMKAEGSGDRNKMFFLAAKESKFVTAMMSVLFIPLCIEMPNVLTAWLGEIPSNAVLFCRFMLIAFMIDQITYGLNSANQAIGNIRNYCLLMYTPKLLTVPISMAILYCGGKVWMVMTLYTVIEAIVSFMRLPYLHYIGGLDIRKFCESVFARIFPHAILVTFVSLMLTFMSNNHYRFIYTLPIAILCGGISAWYMVLTTGERNKLRNILLHKMK